MNAPSSSACGGALAYLSVQARDSLSRASGPEEVARGSRTSSQGNVSNTLIAVPPCIPYFVYNGRRVKLKTQYYGFGIGSMAEWCRISSVLGLPESDLGPTIAGPIIRTIRKRIGFKLDIACGLLVKDTPEPLLQAAEEGAVEFYEWEQLNTDPDSPEYLELKLKPRVGVEVLVLCRAKNYKLKLDEEEKLPTEGQLGWIKELLAKAEIYNEPRWWGNSKPFTEVD
ncbi:uncharacterized protein B0H18DRAFT_1171377 [Fomitopsis serialis]|uniref:uncharacterized protein n=1 Tax=Fomitopsis serialis TaxID=139415 RepID=UPI00200755E9|nr:uncharacterized protein B0H18DRAFT_1171377 [Neoantrodia serialis]KAH9925100.1 hypothetical protein B0H18DRAFT_1171377 [Neoantrodia serialis]